MMDRILGMGCRKNLAGSGYNRHEMDMVTGQNDLNPLFTSRGLRGLESGCHRLGISRRGPLTQCLWWCAQTVNTLQAGEHGYLL